MSFSQSLLALDTGEALHGWIANGPCSGFSGRVTFENVRMVDTDLSSTSFKFFDQWHAFDKKSVNEVASSSERPGVLAMVESIIFAS